MLFLTVGGGEWETRILFIFYVGKYGEMMVCTVQWQAVRTIRCHHIRRR